MKKHLYVAMLASLMAIATLTACMSGTSALSSGSSNAGSVVGGQNGGSTANDILGSLLGTLIGNAVPVSEATIVGTWVYNTPEVRFESENLLAQAGGQVAAASISKKLEDLYASVGIQPGTSGFIFNSDKTCTIALGSQAIKGTYTVDPSTNSLNIASSTGLIKLNAKVYFGLNSLVVLFDGNKLLSLAQTLSAFTGQQSSSIGAISSALSNYKGLLVGMDLQKQK